MDPSQNLADDASTYPIRVETRLDGNTVHVDSEGFSTQRKEWQSNTGNDGQEYWWYTSLTGQQYYSADLSGSTTSGGNDDIVYVDASRDDKYIRFDYEGRPQKILAERWKHMTAEDGEKYWAYTSASGRQFWTYNLGRKDKKQKSRDDTTHNLGRKDKKQKSRDDTDQSYSIDVSIMIFRGEPDTYYRRHTMLHFTSADDPGFHVAVHAQRKDDMDPWTSVVDEGNPDWTVSNKFLTTVYVGNLRVSPSQNMEPVTLAASVSVKDREKDWNCQHFTFEGLRFLCKKYFDLKWYGLIEGMVATELLFGALE